MMKSMLAAVVGLAGIAAGANAAWGLKFEVSNDNGATWSSSVNANVGDAIKFRVGTYFDVGTPVTTSDGTGGAAMLNRFTGSNQFTNWVNGADTITGLARTLPQGNAALLTNSNNGTIGTAGATSFGSNLALASLPEVPVTYNEIYTGIITIGDNGTGLARTLVWMNKTFGVAANNIKGATFYNYGSPTNKLSGGPDTARTDLTAEINVAAIPAPSALALLGLGGLAVARRRRA